MPLPNILRKASNYILGECGQDNRRVVYQDGEALFCKNNVCVHPPTLMRQHADVVHHPGYMTVTCKLNKNSNLPTLHLSWIPNSTLRKHPTTLESLSARNVATQRATPISPRSPRSEKTRDVLDAGHELENENANANENENENANANENGNGKLDVCLEVKEAVDCGDCERVCSGSSYGPLPSGRRDHRSSGIATTTDGEKPAEAENRRVDSIEGSRNEENGDSKERGPNDSSDAKSIDEEPRFSFHDDANIKSRSLSLTSTCSLSIAVPTDGTYKERKREGRENFDVTYDLSHTAEEMPTWMRSPELLALQHNLAFPESATASPVTLRRAHRCRRFSVDLGEMRSLRLFFADPACTCGQLVVASRESQYKILHFHHGGLDRLATTLHQWHQLLYPRLNADTEESLPYRYGTRESNRINRE